MARSNLAQQTCCVNRSRTRSSYSANVSGSTFARIISMSSPNCPRSRIRSSWAPASSTVTWTPPFQLRFLTLNTHRTTPGRSGASSGPKKNVIRNSSDIAPQSTGKSAGESMNLGSASIAGLYSITECRRSRRGGAERGAYRRVCGAATPKPPVAVERVTPHGRPDAARGVQPGLRGLDGETPSCAGLCGGRTRSKSNGFPARRQDPRGGGLVLAVEFLAEFDELALEGFEAVGDRVGHVGVIHRRLGDALPPFRLNDPGRHADDRGVRRDRLQYNGVSSDLDVIADLDPAENLCAGAHHHMISQRWMALAALLAGAS